MRLILASGSPRRADLLRQLGLDFDVRPTEIDETRHPDEPGPDYVRRLAREKAMSAGEPDSVVIAADTTVVHGGSVLGKPGHPEEARSMLRRLSGEFHEVFTGLAVAAEREVHSLVDATRVKMLSLTEDEIADYVDGGEPMDKAGAYALQGWGAIFIESITGSPYTVVGLPLHLLPRLMRQAGTELDRWRATGGLT